MGALTHNGEVLQRLPSDASQINFDKTGTNLNSTQTENAIKEVNTKVNTNTDDITQLKSGLTNLNTLTAVTPTVSEGITGAEATTIYKNNILAVCSLNFSVSENKTSGDTVFTGLPRPKNPIYFSGCTNSKILRFTIENDGSIVLRSDFTTNDGWVNVSVTYPLSGIN